MRAFLLLAFFAIVAPAFALDWSFKVHPHPLFDELTQDEHDAIFAAIRDESERECAKAQRLQFQIYLKRYPSFADTGTSESRKKAWLHHVLGTPLDVERTCILFAEVSKLMDLTKNAEETDFFFCGKFSRPPESAKEEEIATLIREIFGYIQTDEPGRANKFLSYNAIGPIIELHPDIEYYYRARFTPPDYIDKKKVMRQTVHPNHTISPKRRTELDQAIEAGDVQRVIDIMGDCFRSK
ncbi:hypothetical protein MXMO3_00894 [Maritalea myrionectae]|uniref:Uncharacterized protein n=1 Tax=Maritalea myrionectae TaxID=454601 RepID=A0A2R4MC05_9HYPH|nr:hypothetical protein [Maritalea myrionectae]AVX03426.1 hypothetical protein MXMO3_00894 [Maritalea myrionectae]